MPAGPAPARARAIARVCAWAATAAVILACALAGPAQAANFTAAQNADLLLGANSYTGYVFDDGARMTYGMSSPNGVAVDASGSVYVGDSETNRLMRWGTTPATDGAAMTNVLMKSGGSQASWRTSCSGGAEGPEQISVVGDGATTRLAVADRFNDRVVLFTTEETTDGPSGSVVIGQSGTATCSTGTTGATRMSTPTSVWTDGTRVAVADSGNNRVLLWNAWPTTGQAADVVLGQADFTANSANRGGSTGQGTLDYPKSVTFDGTYLYVADTGNDRVLVWTGWPASNGANANFVLGQAGFAGSSSQGCSSTGMSYPVAVTTTGSGASHKIAVAAQYHHRVLVYTGFQAAPANNYAASDVLGQGSMGACRPNRNDGVASAASLRSPNGLAFDGSGNLWVADTLNHRVLRFGATTTGTSANRVLGHAAGAGAFSTSVPMDGVDDNVFGPRDGATMSFESSPVPSVAPDGSLFVTDPFTASATWWSGAPAATNEAFDRRLGQPSRADSGRNGPSDIVSATSLCDAHGSWTDGVRLLIADTCNDRVLVWTTFPSSDTDPADFVLGQANFTSGSSAAGATRMDSPHGVTSDGTDVYVADTLNDRVLVFRNFWAAPANGKAADVLLGQTTWTNTAGSVSLTRVSTPAGIDIWDDRLVVADRDNHRVVIWNDASTLTDGEPIDAVIGQADATSRVSGTIAEDASDVAVEANAVFWVEDCRAFVLDPIPTSGFVTSGASQIGTGCSSTPAQNAIESPSGIDVQGGRAWIAIGQFGRLMRWTDTTAPTLTAGPTATVRCDGTVTVTWTTSESTTTELYWDTVTRASYGAYANPVVDTAMTGLTHSLDLSFATAGVRYARVRAVDWRSQEVVSSEFSFTVPSSCPAPTTMLADDVNAQAGTGRANPSTTSAPPIGSTSFHSSWLNASGVPMDGYESETWSTPPEHAGGLWHLDSSNAADPNSASTAAMSWTGTATWEAGAFGQAASVNASRAPTVADSGPLRKGNDFTVDVWFRTSDLSGSSYPMVLSKTDLNCGPGERCNYAMLFNVGTSQFCALATTTASGNPQRWACAPQGTLANGAWHHAAMTVSSTNDLRLYLDGALAAGPVAMGAPATTGADVLALGTSGGLGNVFIGGIDEVRFSPVAHDAGSILGYYRTQRPHAQLLHDSAPQPLGTSCATAARCADHVYGMPTSGADDILRAGARYWQRARYNTQNNDYWSGWGVDWFETDAVPAITVTVGSSVALGAVTPGSDTFGATTVRITMLGSTGYRLLARDESDSWGLQRLDGLASVPDRQDGAVAPATWAAGAPGFFGVSVRDATGGRMAKWGAGTGWPATDVTNNRYTGLEATTDVVLHERASGPATDLVDVVWRGNPALNQPPGAYDGLITLTAVASP